MRKVVLFHLIILLFSCNQSNESNTKSGDSKGANSGDKIAAEDKPINEEAVIAEINQKFDEINENIATYETKSQEIIGGSAEGGELKSYYQNIELKKIVVNYYGELGKSKEAYYLSEKDLFFASVKQSIYDKPMSVKDSKVDRINENHYYFKDSKLIRWLDLEKEKVIDSNFSQKETEVLQKVKELKSKLENTNLK